MLNDETDEELRALRLENSRLRATLEKIAFHLRSTIRADTAICALNAAKVADRVDEVAWGTVSLEGLQRQVRNLCHAIAFPEYAAFLTRRIADESAKPQRVQQQNIGTVLPGGIR